MTTTPDPVPLSVVMPHVSAAMAREIAVTQGVCIRPIMRRVLDRETGSDTRVAISCGSTRARVCPACADKARRLRIQQCAIGWHRDTEPDRPDPDDDDDQACNEDPVGDLDAAGAGGVSDGRRVRSTRRRHDVPDLPRVPMEDRTIGRAFTGNDGRLYRPSMFLTLTLPSYGKVRDGVPVDPASYDYRRAALDAVLFARLVDRFWTNLRRSAGYDVQYFGAVEPQRRLAAHLHAALRGAIPHVLIRQVVAATYVHAWWPAFDQPVYVDRVPRWDGSDYVDPDTGVVLPTWVEALDDLDPDAGPAYVARFGSQVDSAGIIAPSENADRAIRYLTKYLTKSIADAHTPDDIDPDAGYEAHIDRLHAELRYLPCGERCASWLRYGIQPKHRTAGLRPGRCPRKAHDREHLGLGGRRVLVSRQWSGKTLKEHKADRATVVREALEAAGILAPEVERMAATVLASDGQPRFVDRHPTRPDHLRPGDLGRRR